MGLNFIFPIFTNRLLNIKTFFIDQLPIINYQLPITNYIMNTLFKPKKILVFLFFILALQQDILGQGIQFNLTTLKFGNFSPPAQGTALKFGPDSRLYVADLNGQIRVYTIIKSGNDYTVVAAETIFHVQTIPNYDDIGTLAWDGRSNRQVTGITVVGTSQNPIIYVTSSDPKWGGPTGSGGDRVLDTNSGIVTKLSWNGTSWDFIDLVRGLPRSEENHSLNGLEYTFIMGKPYLLVTSGGSTNAGSPGKNFAYTVEYALASAVLSIDLNAIESIPDKIDPISGRKYKYDLPTLDDPSRPNVNNIYNPNDPGYNGIDVGDPFGGNDGLNMAKIVENGPVQIFSGGYRNTYDVLVMDDGKVFLSDNGPNANWGGMPENEGNPLTITNRYLNGEPGNNATNPSVSGEYVTNQDHLMMITDDIQNYTFGSFYGGHPTPIRANPGVKYNLGASFPFNPGGAGLFTRSLGDDSNWTNLIPLYPPNQVFRTQILEPVAPGNPNFDSFASNSLPVDWPPVPTNMANPEEADYRAPDLVNPNGPQPKLVTIWNRNTNALAEYKSSAFNNAIKGAIIAGKNGGFLHLVTLNGDGTLKTLEQEKWNLNGGNALGLYSTGDDEIFPGTIWVATLNSKISILTPSNTTYCPLPTDIYFDPNADYDSDGYTNQDEIANGTDYCSGASKPNDFDEDFLSNLNDPDDDQDGITDDQDPFQLGKPTDLPINNELFSDKTDELGRPFGYLGLGLTGLMNNGAPNPNWLNWLDVPNQGPLPNDIFGGAAGAIQVAMTSGTANGVSNNQEKGFQFGINMGTQTGEVTVTVGLIGLKGPQMFFDIAHNGELGIQFGDGTQSNFFKLIFTQTNIIAALEINNLPDASPLIFPISVNEQPTANENVDFILKINPINGTVQSFVQIGERPIISLGTKQLSGSVLEAVQDIQKPVAIGIIGSTFQNGVEFLSTWDYIRVEGDQPYTINNFEPVFKQVSSPQRTISLSEYFNDNQGIENLVFSIQSNSNSAIPATINGSNLTISFPSTPNDATIKVRATDQQGFFIEQDLVVNVIPSQRIVYRINAGGGIISGENNAPNWQSNSQSGQATGVGYQVNGGSGVSGSVYFENRHSSIPTYISEATFEEMNQSARTHTQSLEYTIPVTNGNYIVNLYFSNTEIAFSSIGSRVFDINLEGSTRVSNFDIISSFGNAVGGMVSAPVTITDGILNIVLARKIGNVLISGIELIDTNPTLPITIIESVADQNSVVGEELDGNLFFRASGGFGALNYSAQNLPPGVDIEPVNGRIFGTIQNSALAGSPYSVTIRVNDSNAPVPNEETHVFTWSIESFDSWKLLNENQSYSSRHEHSFVRAGEKFYMMGGRENGLDLDIYDYKTDTWETKTGISPFRFNHFQAVEYKGLIWIIGAFQNNDFPTEQNATHIWTYDPVMEKYYRGPEIPVSRRRGATGLVVYQDKFYLVGGNTNGHNGGFVSFFDVYDPSTGTWTILPNAPRARDHAHAALFGNKMYLASGRLSGGVGGVFGSLVNEVDVFNFETMQWSTLPSSSNIPTARAGALVANFENKLIVAGGEVPDNSASLNVVEILDPVTNTWTTGPSMNFPRHGIQGIVSGNGLFVTGGSPTRGGGNQKNMEYFGINNPVGSPIQSSTLSGPASIQLQKGVLFQTDLSVVSGNQAIFIDTVYFQGNNAANFVIVDNKLNNAFLLPNTSNPVNILYNGNQLGFEANLVIKHGFADTFEIPISVSGFNILQLGLLGHWDMEEGSGNTLIDQSGLNNHATISNSAGISWIQGPRNFSISLPGTSTRFGSVAHNPSLVVASQTTVAAWIRPTEISTKRILTKGVNGIELGTHNTRQIEFRFNRQANGTTYRILSRSQYPIDGNTWIHVAVTYNGSIASIYINGQLDNSVNFNNANIIPDTGALQIGARGGIDRWIGGIDDLRLYNRALTGAEIITLYSGSVQVPGIPTLTSPSNFSENVNVSPTLSWTPQAFADEYHLQVSSSITFNDLIIDRPDLTTQSLLIENLEYGVDHFWRVAASNVSGKSNWSEIYRFKTIEGSEDETLVGFWKMEENGGSVLLDNSGKGNNASISIPTNVVWGNGKEGLGITMNGIKDGHGNVPHNTTLEFSNALTITAWIKPNQLSHKKIISKMNGNGFELGTNMNGKFEFRINRAANGSAYRLLSLQNYPTNGNTWVHLAVTFNGTTSSIYVNGILDNSANYAPFIILPNSSSLQIGAREGIDRWEGGLDEVRLYKRVLNPLEILNIYQGEVLPPSKPQLISPSNNATGVSSNINLNWMQDSNVENYRVQVSTNQNFSTVFFDQSNVQNNTVQLSGLQSGSTYYWRVLGTNGEGDSPWSDVWSFTVVSVQDPNLIGHWKMNEGSGSVLLDNSGNNLHANFGVSEGIVWVPGIENQAVRFNGANGRYATVPHSPILNLSTQLTVSVWVRPTGLANRQIISKGGPDGFELSTFDGGKIEFRINRETNGSTFRLRSNLSYPTNGQTWMHVAVVFRGNRTDLYINGNLDNSQTYPNTSIISNNTSLQIGTRNLGSNKWIGDLDDLRLYNRALTSQEIQQLFGGSPGLRLGLTNDKFEKSEQSAESKDNEALGVELPKITKLYPNPVDDAIYLELTDLSDGETFVSIYDMKGNIVMERKITVEKGRVYLDIGNLKLIPGSYVLLLNTNGYPKVFKFAKR